MLFKLSAKPFSVSVRCICKQTWNMEKHIAFGTKIIPVLELDDFEQLNLDQNTQQEQSPAETKAYVKTTQAYQCFWFYGKYKPSFWRFSGERAMFSANSNKCDQNFYFSKNHIRVAPVSFWGKRGQALQASHRAVFSCAPRGLFYTDSKTDLTMI